MPRSQTPVESHLLAKAYLGLLPSSAKKLSAFPSGPLEGYPNVHHEKISGFYHAACILDSSSFVRPLLGLHVEFTTDLLARL